MNVCWKLIPGFGSCNSKRPSNKVHNSWADDEVVVSGRSQSLSAASWCHWLTQIDEIRWCKSVQRFKCQQTTWTGRAAGLEASEGSPSAHVWCCCPWCRWTTPPLCSAPTVDDPAGSEEPRSTDCCSSQLWWRWRSCWLLLLLHPSPRHAHSCLYRAAVGSIDWLADWCVL